MGHPAGLWCGVCSGTLDPMPSGLVGTVIGHPPDAEPTTDPSTWSTHSPAARRFSRKVSLQAACVSVLSLMVLSCCSPSFRSSSQTRTKSARNQQGQKSGLASQLGCSASGRHGEKEPSLRTLDLLFYVSFPALALVLVRAGRARGQNLLMGGAIEGLEPTLGSTG